jgi:hypothetical protein
MFWGGVVGGFGVGTGTEGETWLTFLGPLSAVGTADKESLNAV